MSIASRLQNVLSANSGITSKKMFGGICYLHRGNMLCGITKEGKLMVRVGPAQYEEALARPHAHEMDFTGRPMRGMIYVDEGGYPTEEALAAWIEMGLNFTRTLPKK